MAELATISRVRAALFEILDPELDVNIMDLGLIYGVTIDNDQHVSVRMTLTTPGCPMSDSIQKGVRYRLSKIPGVKEVSTNLVFDPPWTPEKMSDRCKAKLWQ